MPAEELGTVRLKTSVWLAGTVLRFSKSATQDLAPGGLQFFENAAKPLKAYQCIQSLSVIGFTDRLGSDRYYN